MRVFAPAAFRYLGKDYPYGPQDLAQALADTLIAAGKVVADGVPDGGLGGGPGGGAGATFNLSGVGAIVSYTVPGYGPQYMFPQSGPHASRPEASAYNVGMVWTSNDLNGQTTFTNFSGLGWTKTGVGTAYETEGMRYKRGTLTEILASTGDYIGQHAIVNDYGDMVLEWLPAAAWGLPRGYQRIGLQHTQQLASGTSDTVLYTQPGTGGLPAIWRPNDSLWIRSSWSQSTANTNSRQIKIKIGGTSIYTFNIASTSKAGFIHEWEMNFRNSLSSQICGSSNADIYGAMANAPATTAVDFSVAKTLELTGLKAVSGDTLALEKVQILACGGG